MLSILGFGRKMPDTRRTWTLEPTAFGKHSHLRSETLRLVTRCVHSLNGLKGTTSIISVYSSQSNQGAEHLSSFPASNTPNVYWRLPSYICRIWNCIWWFCLRLLLLELVFKLLAWMHTASNVQVPQLAQEGIFIWRFAGLYDCSRRTYLWAIRSN